jgi:hypothetical protein
MVTALVIIVFISGAIIALSQLMKINSITLKYGSSVFSRTNGMTPLERKEVLKAFVLCFSSLIGAFLIIALIFYLDNPTGFHIYY